MEKLFEGLMNIRTTILAVVMFVLGFLPFVVQVLADLSAFLTQVSVILSSGDIYVILAGLWTLKTPLMALVASIGLLIARDWRQPDELGK